MNSVKFQDTKLIHRNFVEFLNTNNKLSEREIKKTIPFTIASKRLKFLGVNLTKEVKDLYLEISKTLMNENSKTNGKTFFFGAISIYDKKLESKEENG